jgi:hypothetical protein
MDESGVIRSSVPRPQRHSRAFVDNRLLTTVANTTDIQALRLQPAADPNRSPTQNSHLFNTHHYQ